jgi:hypothetical protein
MQFPVIHLAFTRTIVNAATLRAALSKTAFHLSIVVRAIEVVAYARLFYRFDLLVLCFQAGARDSLLEEANKRAIDQNTARLVWASS